MKNRYKLLILIVAGVFSFTSCEKNLDITQHSVSSLDTYYKTDSEAEEGIVACYAAFRTLHTGFGAMQAIGNYLSDDVWVGGGNHYDGTNYKLGDYAFDAAFGNISSLYNNLYTLVYRTNVVIESVKGESAVMKRAVAEAKVFRAYAYFYLTAYWGTPPLVDHTLTETEYMQPNSTTAALWAFVEQNINEAVNSGALSQKASLSEKNYRVTKQFAQALLGKAYLFQKKYSDAATMLDNVINSGLYDLPSNLSNIGTPLGNMSTESIFEVNTLNDRSQSGTNNNIRWTSMGLRGEKYSYTSANIFATATWGFEPPAKSLYDAFVSVEGVNGYRLNNVIKTRQQMIDQFGVTNIMLITDNEGYFGFKYRIIGSIWAGYFYANNTRVMKYSEVLLLAAEAHLQSSNPSKATDYINLIRTRAQAPTIAGTVTMDQIKAESRLELCWEGQRYENIIRWGDAATLLANKGLQNPALKTDGTVIYEVYNTDPAKVGFKAGKHELLPFPETEMAINKNMVQNPGW
ncbi:MAG: RagB/SusD family nutrient uptake outer membrane protein [Bacteroidota bacterium]